MVTLENAEIRFVRLGEDTFKGQIVSHDGVVIMEFPVVDLPVGLHYHISPIDVSFQIVKN